MEQLETILVQMALLVFHAWVISLFIKRPFKSALRELAEEEQEKSLPVK
jgi:hypothetical protein